MVIITTMCKLFLAMGIGFYLYKKQVLTLDTNARLSKLLIQFGVPCMVLNSVASVPHDNPSMVLRVFIAGVISYGIYVVIGYLFSRIVHVPEFLKGTFICMLIFANTAYMGYPVVQAMFGDAAIFYTTIFNMPFNLLFFSLGLYLLRRDSCLWDKYQKRAASVPDGRGEKRVPDVPDGGEMRAAKRPGFWEIFNGGLISSIAALIIYFADIPLPDLFYSCVGFIGGIVSPVSMIIIGSSLAALSLREIEAERGVWLMLPVRLCLVPIIIWLLLHLFISDPVILAMCAATAGMPVGSIMVMGTGDYPHQNRTATIGVSVSTICSLITIPIMMALLNLTL